MNMQVACKRRIPEKLGKKLKAVVTISVPYDKSLFAESNQHGEAFLRTMELVKNDDRIEEVEVLVADSLQEHNLKAIYGLNEQTAKQKAKELGAYWYRENIEANSLFFKKFGKKIAVKFWDTYKNHQDFIPVQSKLDSLYSSEKPNGFYQKTRSQAGAFTNKILERVEQSTEVITCVRGDVLEGSIALLKEESAVRVILGSCFHLEYYPDELDSVMATACEKFSEGKPYRVAVSVRKEQENEYKISQAKASQHGFYGKSHSYPPSRPVTNFSFNDNALPSHPLFSAVISSTLLVVDVNDDPTVHTAFLMRYNQFLTDFLVEKQKIAGKQKKSALLLPIDDDIATISDGSSDDETVGAGHEQQQEGKHHQFQFSA